MFNAWLDAAPLRPGLQDLQLYFEEGGGAYRTREELVFVERPRTGDRHRCRSGAVDAARIVPTIAVRIATSFLPRSMINTITARFMTAHIGQRSGTIKMPRPADFGRNDRRKAPGNSIQPPYGWQSGPKKVRE